MKMKSFTLVCAILIGTWGHSGVSVGQTVRQAKGNLVSSAQQRAINAGIAKLKLSGERSVAREWTEEKQVAEFICRPAALPALAKKLKGADRVFLGNNDPESLSLESTTKLVGVGQARFEGGWRDFSFECLMDAKTAKVKNFQITLVPLATI
ncbi:hypothetical protein PAN31117_04656 [Pandoraea anapnoica]|uniref:DUF930 domain-containing protein n=1 Tax=Pandoraea anapnoica TaxID=2508301 RepID=A0A5E5AL07_9BURK|nr:MULTISPECIES: DsrE family protein [Pandoraea]VVE42775.1 hypothetical protein PIN31009_04207 [Pandoraea iniqua]VVE73213.1 hypothetical protein PAN31117_04656 [Pandoraea anapnoica]